MINNSDMQFFLQDGKTAKFIRCDSLWTLDIAEALDFGSVQRAIFFGLKELKNSFQVLQVDSTGLSVFITAIPHVQWSNFQAQAVPSYKQQGSGISGKTCTSDLQRTVHKSLPLSPADFFRASAIL